MWRLTSPTRADPRPFWSGCLLNSGSTPPTRTTTYRCCSRPMPAPRIVAARNAPPALAICGGTVVTMDPRRSILVADILVDADGRIGALLQPGDDATRRARRAIDAS